MDGTLPKFLFLKLQGRETPIIYRGWIGVHGMDLDHNITQKVHMKIFLMKAHCGALAHLPTW